MRYALPFPQSRNALVIGFIILAFIVTSFLAFRADDQRMGLLYVASLVVAFGLFLAVPMENRTSLWSIGLGFAVGIGSIGLFGTLSVLVNSVVYGTWTIEPYAQAMVPDMNMAAAPFTFLTLDSKWMGIAYQAFTVAPAEELLFRVILPFAFLGLVPLQKQNKFMFAIVMMIIWSIFSIFHSTAWGAGIGSAGLYVSAFAFSGVMTWLYMATSDVFAPIGAHFAHNTVVSLFTVAAISGGGIAQATQQVVFIGLVSAMIGAILIVLYVILWRKKW